MLFSFYTILIILIVHYLADFCLQTHEQSQKKSSEFKWLIYHTGTYSLVWLFTTWALYSSFAAAFLFATITLVVHTATDYVTSRIGKPFWEKQDFHNGFAVIGFDQVLHYVQLLLTHHLITTIFAS